MKPVTHMKTVPVTTTAPSQLTAPRSPSRSVSRRLPQVPDVPDQPSALAVAAKSSSALTSWRMIMCASATMTARVVSANGDFPMDLVTDAELQGPEGISQGAVVETEEATKQRDIFE